MRSLNVKVWSFRVKEAIQDEVTKCKCVITQVKVRSLRAKLLSLRVKYGHLG